MMKKYLLAVAFCLWSGLASATCTTLPFVFSTGLIFSSQVNSNFSYLGGCAAAAGANSDITSTSALATMTNVASIGGSYVTGVANGGTGATSLTAHGVLMGEATSPFGVSTAGTLGQPFLSGGGSADGAYGALNLAGVGITGVLGAANGGTALSSPGVLGNVLTSTGVTWQSAPVSAGAPTFVWGQISGCVISNNVGTPNTKTDVAACQAADSTNAAIMSFSSPKTVDFTVSGAGGLDTGSIAATKWYAILIISGSGGTNVMATLETAGTPISPTMPTGFTVYRYIGSTASDGSSHLRPFKQIGAFFYWGTQTIQSHIDTATQTLLTLDVPLAVKTIPLFRSSSGNSATGETVIIASPDETDVAPSGSPAFATAPGNDVAYAGSSVESVNPGPSQFTTNLSGQLGIRASGTTNTTYFVTRGWHDPHVAQVW